MKVAIIGAGNMGGAVARGLAQGSFVKDSDIMVSNPSVAKLEALQADFPEIRVTQNNREVVKGADWVVLAVKPWKVEEVLAEIKNELDYSSQAVVSMAGGVSTSQLAAWLKREDGMLPALFVMIPNTAIAVGHSMTFITSVGATEAQNNRLLAMCREMGDAMWIEERLMGAGMALASCGIAYALRYIRAAMEGGTELGFYPKDAQQVVMQTLMGAVELLRANGSHPEWEIDRVTTPGGFTIKGLNAMERAGFTNSVIEGLRASSKK